MLFPNVNEITARAQVFQEFGQEEMAAELLRVAAAKCRSAAKKDDFLNWWYAYDRPELSRRLRQIEACLSRLIMTPENRDLLETAGHRIAAGVPLTSKQEWAVTKMMAKLQKQHVSLTTEVKKTIATCMDIHRFGPSTWEHNKAHVIDKIFNDYDDGILTSQDLEYLTKHFGCELRELRNATRKFKPGRLCWCEFEKVGNSFRYVTVKQIGIVLGKPRISRNGSPLDGLVVIDVMLDDGSHAVVSPNKLTWIEERIV